MKTMDATTLFMVARSQRSIFHSNMLLFVLLLVTVALAENTSEVPSIANPNTVVQNVSLEVEDQNVTVNKNASELQWDSSNYNKLADLSKPWVKNVSEYQVFEESWKALEYTTTPKIDAVYTPTPIPIPQALKSFARPVTITTTAEPKLVTSKPEMHRIIQPYQELSQSRRINLQLPTKLDEFKPSPELSFEYNKFPVVPAFPEAKSFGNTDQKIRFPQNTNTYDSHPYPFQKTVLKRPINFQEKILLQQHSQKPVIEETIHTGLATPSPWKKIIKILTAFIPIGLLISALTPSVITITPMNGTYGRARSETPNKPVALDLISKLQQDGCDERIFCEILLSAEQSKSPKKNVEGLLQNYSQGNDHKEKVDRIYSALKEGNCDLFKCESIK